MEFGKLLKSLDGQKYGAYKRLKGEYAFDKFHLIIDHIQADPYAPPSKVRAKMQRHIANIPDELLDTENKKLLYLIFDKGV